MTDVSSIGVNSLDQVHTDISYRPGATDEYARSRCQLDVYVPKGQNFPTMVFFHGGGMTAFDRHSCEPLARRLAHHGIGVVLADYRLAPQARVPVFIEDAAAAAHWTLQNTSRLGGDPARVFIGGFSAGAYLATLVAQSSRYLHAWEASVSDFAGLIAVSGQMTTHQTVRSQLDLDLRRPHIGEFAPLHWATEPSPRALVVLAEDDMPQRQEENHLWLAARADAGHTEDEIHIEEGRTHKTIINGSLDPDEPVAVRMARFVQLGS